MIVIDSNQSIDQIFSLKFPPRFASFFRISAIGLVPDSTIFFNVMRNAFFGIRAQLSKGYFLNTYFLESHQSECDLRWRRRLQKYSSLNANYAEHLNMNWFIGIHSHLRPYYSLSACHMFNRILFYFYVVNNAKLSQN